MEHGIWSLTGIILSIIFGMLGGIFLYYRENACNLILGYNFKTKEERLNYDEIRISRHYRNMFFFWAVLFLIGALGSGWLGKIWFGIACFIWLISFCRNIHIDEEKDFNKFKKI